MKLKLFGKEIFDFVSNKSEPIFAEVRSSIKESKFLPDFYTMRDFNNQSDSPAIWINQEVLSDVSATKPLPKDEKERKKKFALTPKRVFELKFLNKNDYKINTDAKYIDEQITSFKDKLNLIKTAEFDMSRGVNEIASILLRLENRKKYTEVKGFFEQFAYTTTDRINKVVKNHDNLKLGGIDQFIADLPKEASSAMKEYSKNTQKLCEKNAVFYIIADKKDFQKTDKRRDPILLAQSPFAHVWQILGAWDEEMLFLEEL